MGTLFINGQGKLQISGTQVGDLAPKLAIAQNFALGHKLPTDYSPYTGSRGQCLFYFQAGNLEFLGLNLAWSVDVLSALGLISMLSLVMTLGELVFNSRVVGRLGGVLFLFQGWPPPIHSLTSKSRAQEALRATSHLFVSQWHLFFVIGPLLLVLMFLIDQYRQRLLTNPRTALMAARGFIFSGFLLCGLLLSDTPMLRPTAVALFCVFAAYGLWWLWRQETAQTLGRVVAATLAASVVTGGVIHLFAVYNDSRVELNFEKEPLVKGFVFRNMLIYKFADSLPAISVREDLSKAPVAAFQGGHGAGRGQFDSPRGIAIDSMGNIFVADTGNGRIQKFSPTGTFLGTMGIKGIGYGQVGAPNGIAIDRTGNIYVADASKHRVEKMARDGTVIDEWKGPDPGFYGPRRIAIGPNDSIYVVDQGRTRMVKFSPDGQVLTTWGSGGKDDGQFRDHTSVAPTGNKLYVADPINSRIQVFNSDGTFLTKWLVPEWGRPYGFEDLAVDSQRGRLYASSANINAILVFDLNGTRLENLRPNPPDSLDAPSGLALRNDRLYVINASSARVSVIDLHTR